MTYIETLQDVIRKTHGCESRHLESVPVHETFQGQTVWQGVVEVFALLGHPNATGCYAWGHHAGVDEKGSCYIAVLKVPPVDSPRKAVQAHIVASSQGKAL